MREPARVRLAVRWFMRADAVFIAVFPASLGYLGGSFPIAADEPVLARVVASFQLGLAVTLWLLAGRIERDPRLLLVPVAFIGINVLDHAAEFATWALGIPFARDPMFLPALLVELASVTVYLAAFAALRHAPRPPACVACRGTGKRARAASA